MWRWMARPCGDGGPSASGPEKKHQRGCMSRTAYPKTSNASKAALLLCFFAEDGFAIFERHIDLWLGDQELDPFPPLVREAMLFVFSICDALVQVQETLCVEIMISYLPRLPGKISDTARRDNLNMRRSCSSPSKRHITVDL